MLIGLVFYINVSNTDYLRVGGWLKVGLKR